MKKIIYYILIFWNISLIFGQNFEPPTEKNNIDDDVEFGISQADINSATQDDIEKLFKRLDFLEKHDKKKYDALVKQIGSTKNQLISMNRIFVAVQCGQLLLQTDFSRASEMLKKVYTDNYDEVVYFAYATNVTNFNKIINFANKLHNEKQALILYQELFKLAKIDASIDDLVNMVVNINRHYRLHNNWSEFRKQVLDLLLSKVSAEVRSNSKLFDSKHSNSRMNTVVHLDQETAYSLIIDVAKKLYSKTNLNSLIKFVHEHTNKYLRVKGYAAIYDKIVQDGNLQSQSLFYLGTMYRMTKGDIKDDSDGIKQELDGLFNKLPACIKNAALLWQVCIKNVVSGNYLKVSDENKESKWQVLVSPGETSYDRAKWRFEAMQNGIYVMLKNIYLNRNIKEGNEAWMGHRYSKKIEISLPMNSGDTWSIHSTGSSCFIKRYGDDSTYLRDYEGSVMISTVGNENAKWVIESC